MSIPTVVLNEAIPAGGDKVREGDNRIIEYKTQNREVMGVDHKYESSGQDADMGKHDQVSLLEKADIGVGAEGKPILGAQTVGGKAELVFTDEDNNDIPITSAGSLVALPAGVVYEWGGAIADIPSGYLFCNGAAVSRSTYAVLFAAIGTIHGIGDGSTTFNLPDHRDASVMGAKEDDSGVPKTNVTGSLTASGGAATVDLSHNHGGNTGATAGSTSSGADADTITVSHTHTIASGGSATQSILGPYKVMVKMIKT